MRTPLALAALLALAASAAPSAQSSVRDSVRMTLGVYQYANVTENGGYNCGAGVYAVWPNVLQDLLGSPTRTYGYRDYGRVATDGMYIPSGYGEATNNPGLGLLVPEGSVGHNPQLGGGGYSLGGGDGTIPASCANFPAGAYATLGGGWTLLNAAPFRVTDWYATFSIPSGTPIALFEWEPADGLAVDFDGSFENDPVLSREVDATAAGGKRPVASYAWDFGDGDSGSGATPTHAYDEPGEYVVRLVVTDDDGEEAAREETVTVHGAHLTVEILSATEEAGKDDDIVVTARVTNTSDDPIFDVRADRVFVVEGRLPDSLNVRGGQMWGLSIEPRDLPAGEEGIVTRSRLDPGESFEVERTYYVKASATYRNYAAGESFRPVDVFADWTRLIRVQGETPDADSVEVRQPCTEADPPCARTLVRAPDPLKVTLTLSTADGEVTEAPAGRQRRRNASGGWITDHRLTRLGEGVLCLSGCVNVTVTVTDLDDNPVEGAMVNVSASAVTGDVVVTPDQGGGLFCDDEVVAACGRPLELAPTDAGGEAHGFYYFPGLIGPTNTTVLTVVEDEGLGRATDRADLRMVPTVVEFGPGLATVTDEAADALRYTGRIRSGLNITGQINDACKKVNGFLLAYSPVVAFESEYLRAKDFAADAVCGHLIGTAGVGFEVVSVASEALAMLDLLKKWAEFGEVYWFFNTFQISSVGLGRVGVASPAPPFIDNVSDFTTAINDAMGKVYASTLSQGRSPGPITLEIFETSYVRPVTVGGTTFDDAVPALYLRIRADGGALTHTALVREGYRPGFWLTETGATITTLGGSASAGDASLTLDDPSGRTASGTAGVVADGPFQPGHLVTLDPGEPTAETVQVTAASGTTVHLSAPLRFAHVSGATAARVDSMAVGVPPAPIPAAFAAGQPGAPAAPELAWFSSTPVASYAVEVARDSLFADVVASADALDRPAFTPPSLADGLHFWRVRGANLAGDGPWSARYAFVVGAPEGDDLADAIPLAGPLPLGAAQWAVAATAEAGEATPSCGAGDNSLWFVVTPSASGELRIDTEASTFDTILSVWSGTAHPLSETACDDDTGGDSAVAAGLSVVTVDATAGVPFTVRVAGADGAEGLVVLYVGAPRAVGAEGAAPPSALGLGSPYPNPARGRAVVLVALPEAVPVRLALYDALGREVAVAHEGSLGAGRHPLPVETGGLPTGLYVVRLEAGGEVLARRLTVVR